MVKYNKNIRNLFEANCSQMWFNAQKMDLEERKNTIAYIIGLDRCQGSFVDYRAKYFLAYLIDSSECFFNNKGYCTPVKEFQKIGWYKETRKDIHGDPIFELDFNKVMN